MRRLPLVLVLALGCATPGTPPPQDALRLAWEMRTETMPLSIALDEPGRPYLYAAMKEGGVAILDASAPGRAPVRIGEVPKRQLRDLDAMYLTRQGRHLYVALGNFFDNRGSAAGLAIIDVQDPRAPVVSSTWTTSERVEGSASVLVDGDIAYLGAMAKGVFVLDVSNKAAIRLVASFLPDVNFPQANPGPVQHPNARGMAIRDDRLYLAFDAGGLRVLDVSDERNPREVGRYVNESLLGKQQAYNHVALDWPYAYVGVDYCGMEVLDVRDPAAIRQVAWWNPWSCEARSNIWFNSPGHVNEVQLDMVRKRVFISAGDSELQVVDVSDPQWPRLAARYGRPGDGQGAWGVTWGRDVAYVGYIQALIPFRGTWPGIRAISTGP